MYQKANLSILLGAGFSKWVANLPLASELFDFSIEPFGKRDKAKMEFVRRAKNAWDEEHVNGLAEQFIAYAMSFSNEMRENVLWYITRRLSEPYIWQDWHAGKARRHVLMIDENRKFDRPGVTRVREFILRLKPILSCIITTNYDLLIEYALGTKLFNYGKPGEILKGRGPYPVSQWRSPVSLKGSIPLIKMHGSISWDLDGKYTDGRRGITGNALIVAPVPEKTAPTSLAYEWEYAARVLKNSERILVFGFAFNPYDEALIKHFQINGSNIKQVIIIDRNHRIERVQNVWPKAEIVLLSPPPDNETDLNEWNIKFDKLMR